jgi:UPF0755 protein
LIRRVLLLGVLTGIVAAGIVLAMARERLAPVADSAQDVMFVVAPGDPLSVVARRLEREGLVRDARVLGLLARLRGLEASLHAGEYALSGSLSSSEILDRLAEGRVATHSVSVPEGFTARQIGARLAAAGLVDEAAFAAAVADPELATALGVEAPGVEGYLYPETYTLPRGLPASEVVGVFVAQFDAAWDELAEQARARDLSRHEVVTLASIVEKETGAPEERPLIASVFANRLARGMRLESDPTIIYGIPDFDGNLRRRDLENAGNPYNTYRHPGLPPGPIANPGIEAMRAVVQPADTDYLFFVSRNDGTHHFSESYRQHVNAVNRFQLRRGK